MRSSCPASSCAKKRGLSHFKNARLAFSQDCARMRCHVLILTRENCVQQIVSKHDLCISLQKRKMHVQQEAALECDFRVSLQKYEIRVQTQDVKFKYELESPHPHRFEASSSDIPATDLKVYLTRKTSAHQIAPQCHCVQLILMVSLIVTATFR